MVCLSGAGVLTGLVPPLALGAPDDALVERTTSAKRPYSQA
jgi:hypothetical protein